MHTKCILIKYKRRILVVNAHRPINCSVIVIIVGGAMFNVERIERPRDLKWKWKILKLIIGVIL